jgi:hypothetical protein
MRVASKTKPNYYEEINHESILLYMNNLIKAQTMPTL